MTKQPVVTAFKSTDPEVLAVPEKYKQLHAEFVEAKEACGKEQGE